MSKPSNSKNDNIPQTSGCFTTMFQKFICSGNLPTHPSLSDQKPENPAKIHPFTRPLTRINDPGIKSQVQVQVQAQVQVDNNPGIVARLMGLESLPKHDNMTTSDTLFRSKSMNSLHFTPDFDPTRAAFHRRARTSASFHEQGHKLLVKIDENMVSDDVMVQEYEMGFGNKKQRKKEKKENEVMNSKDEPNKKSKQKFSGRTKDSGSKKRHDDEFLTSSSNSSSCGRRRSKLKNSVDENNGGIRNNINNNCLREKCVKQNRKLVVKNNKDKIDGEVVGSSKKKVDHKQEMLCNNESIQSVDLLPSRSPVSVLDYHNEIHPTFKGEEGQETSIARRKTSPKSKLYDHLTQDIVPKSKQYNQEYSNSKIATKQEVVEEEIIMEAADSLVEMLGHISKLTEDYIKDSKWVANYDVLKVQFVEELCLDLGHALLDLLLDELVDVIIMSHIKILY